MRNYYATGRRDGNEKVIIDYLRDNEIPYIIFMPGQGADIMIFLDGGHVAFLEVKNPDAPNRRKQLTITEVQFMNLCQNYGVVHKVVFSVEDVKSLFQRSF